MDPQFVPRLFLTEQTALTPFTSGFLLVLLISNVCGRESGGSDAFGQMTARLGEGLTHSSDIVAAGQNVKI